MYNDYEYSCSGYREGYDRAEQLWKSRFLDLEKEIQLIRSHFYSGNLEAIRALLLEVELKGLMLDDLKDSIKKGVSGE